MVVTAISPRNDDIRAMAMQPDGKLVVAGSTTTQSGVGRDFALARYLVNGVLDPTFGIGGKVITDVGDLDIAEALVLQPDGKLIVAGTTRSGVPQSTARGTSRLARYLPNGMLDPTFGTGGILQVGIIDATSLEPVMNFGCALP
jgi:uncharacterized delta-60 repeat protein